MELYYIKANGQYYYPQEAEEQDPDLIEGCFYPVCYIKKLLFGRWRIDYYSMLEKPAGIYSVHGENQTPNVRLILYPSGIEEIKYRKN